MSRALYCVFNLRIGDRSVGGLPHEIQNGWSVGRSSADCDSVTL